MGGCADSRWARFIAFAAPAAVAVALAWSFSDSFRHPSFFGDQGTRLDQADRLIVSAGRRQWLPFLQLHIHLLYLLRVPVAVYLLIPLAYTTLSLALLSALCRASLRRPCVPTVLILAGFAGSSFHWLGRTLYQEVIVIPLFLALVYLRCFAPQQRVAFVIVGAAAMLTREVFWIWWLAFLLVEGPLLRRDPRLLAALLALAVIPFSWLAITRQSPLLARITADDGILWAGLEQRITTLGSLLVSEWLLPPILCLVIAYAIVLGAAGRCGISLPRYHRFAAISLAATYGYILLYDPWQMTPGNTRMLVPLFAHLLVGAVLAWRDLEPIAGSAGGLGRIAAAAASVSMVKATAVVAALSGTPAPSGAAWEPLRLSRPAAAHRSDWRSSLQQTLASPRDRSSRLRVVFIDIPEREYLKFWLAPFLYDERRRIAAGEPIPPADVIIAADDHDVQGWAPGATLNVAPDLSRTAFLPM